MARQGRAGTAWLGVDRVRVPGMDGGYPYGGVENGGSVGGSPASLSSPI